MQSIYAKQVASISELKKNPSKLINDSDGKPVAILNHNVAQAYLIPADTFEKLIDLIDEKDLQVLVSARLDEKFTPIDVSLDDL